MQSDASTVDNLGGLRENRRNALEEVRSVILATSPTGTRR